MPITGWIAILVLIVMCYMLIKQYETRMVLFGGGFILCCISLTPMAGLNAFAKTMTNGALIMAICSATGFAYCVTFTECDRSLVHYLTRPIRNVGILMIPITSLLTFAINIAAHLCDQHRYSLCCRCRRRCGYDFDSSAS